MSKLAGLTYAEMLGGILRAAEDRLAAQTQSAAAQAADQPNGRQAGKESNGETRGITVQSVAGNGNGNGHRKSEPAPNSIANGR